jgi:molybdopterin-containing oxidoreductase family membrane subunit
MDRAAVLDKAGLIPSPGTSRRFYAAALPSAVVVLGALFAYSVQLRYGIGTAGIGGQVMWAFYITNFVFWTGISHAGILISAVLRLLEVEWRRPLTRCAEALTVVSFLIGAVFPLVHLGRPERFYWLVPYPNERGLQPNFHSPLVWDFLGINLFLIASVVFLWMGMLPDLALLRDGSCGLRRGIYRILALGYTAAGPNRKRLEAAIRGLSLAVIPLSIGSETVVSFIFGSTLNPVWGGAFLAPYFMIGALLSGSAALILLLAVLRRFLGLEIHWTRFHFEMLSKILLALSAVWVWLTFAESFMIWRRRETADFTVLMSKIDGRFALLFYTMLLLCFVTPWLLLGIRRMRTIPSAVLASGGVIIGMWIERYLLIVPTLALPRLSFVRGFYSPTWVEMAITAGTIAGFALLFSFFARWFPVISIWEMSPGHVGIAEVARVPEA